MAKRMGAKTIELKSEPSIDDFPSRCHHCACSGGCWADILGAGRKIHPAMGRLYERPGLLWIAPPWLPSNRCGEDGLRVSRQPLREAGSRPSIKAFARSRDFLGFHRAPASLPFCHTPNARPRIAHPPEIATSAYEPASGACPAISFVISGLPTKRRTILGLSRPLTFAQHGTEVRVS